MRLPHLLPALAATILSLAFHPASAQTALNDGFARDSRQPIDQAYTDHIRKYTTDPKFSSRLVDYLPASLPVEAAAFRVTARSTRPRPGLLRLVSAGRRCLVIRSYVRIGGA